MDTAASPSSSQCVVVNSISKCVIKANDMWMDRICDCGVSPGAEAGASAAGGEPNQREMKLRFWVTKAPPEAEACRCSGDWADGSVSTAGEVAIVTATEEGGTEHTGIEGDCGSTCEDTGGWGVLGLELPVEAPLGGMIGDWEPEEGL